MRLDGRIDYPTHMSARIGKGHRRVLVPQHRYELLFVWFVEFGEPLHEEQIKVVFEGEIDHEVDRVDSAFSGHLTNRGVWLVRGYHYLDRIEVRVEGSHS